MPLRRAIDKFLEEEEELAFNHNPSLQPMENQPAENEGSSGSNFPSPVPAPYMRRLEDRIDQLENRIPRLTQEINSLRRRLAAMTTEKDRLQAEVNRLRGRG